MSEAVVIVLISSMGGTFLTVAGAVFQQIVAAKSAKEHAASQKAEHEEAKTTADEARRENRDSLEDIIARQQKILDNQTLINRILLRDRLRYLLRQFQGADTVPFADKEDIDAMYKIYFEDGHNGTIKAMYEEFMKKRVE